MIQIISNSNETSTGPELVQNGDFSQLGTDLVENGEFDELGTDVITNGSFATDTDWTKGNGWSIAGKAISTQALGSEEVTNGDFSAAGSNLVTNSNFTDTGSELVTNGDFATDSDWAITNSVGSSTNISGGSLNIITDGAYTQAAQNNILTLGKSYVLNYTITSNAVVGYLSIVRGSSSSVVPSTVGTHNFYFESDGGGFAFKRGGGALNVSIDSVSIKELGADWTLGTGWSIGDGFANVNNTTSSGIGQAILEAGKWYKVGFEILRVGDGGVRPRMGGLSGTIKNTVGVHSETLLSGGTGFEINTAITTNDVDVTNISVQELGEGWTLTSGASITALGAKITHTPTAGVISQSPSLVIGKSYKFTYEITEKVSGGLKINSAVVTTMVTTVGTHTRYFEADSTALSIARTNASNNDVTISNISVKEIATSYLTQAVSLSAKTWKIIYSVSDYIAGSVSATDYGTAITANEVGITEYVQIGAISDFRMVNIDGYFEGAVTGISAQLVDPNGYWNLGAGWSFGDDKAVAVAGTASKLTQSISGLSGKSCKVTLTVSNYGGSGLILVDFGSVSSSYITSDGTHTLYGTYDQNKFEIYKTDNFSGDVTNISVEQTDPNNYWTLGTGWSIGTNKAISTVTGSESDITQSILTAGKTYRTVYEIVDYTAGTAQAIVTGSDGADAVAIETYTEDLTTTGTDFSIRSKLGTFDGAVSSVSAKLLGSYEDQSIYVTAADVQTLPQASVYYLVELTSMGSENSLYFIPSSVVANNGRYTKLNFTVVSKDALTQPTVGIISFYDSAGGFDTYPMGFYEFKIYEQTSSTNLDPLLATGLLEKGFAFVRDFSGNMQELTDGFKEYNPTLTQYVYSK